MIIFNETSVHFIASTFILNMVPYLHNFSAKIGAGTAASNSVIWDEFSKKHQHHISDQFVFFGANKV